MKLSKNESLGLDLIRAIASQIVVIGHGISFFGIFKMLHAPNFPWMQNIAVVVFFILSGFVITYSALIKTKNGSYSFFDFFADRASRIFSAYLVALVFVLVIDLLSMSINDAAYAYSNAFNISTFASNLFMLQDYPLHNFIGVSIFNATSFGSARVFWTISIEWWIYMFFGVLFFCLYKNEKISINKSILFVISYIVVSWYLYDSRGGNLSIFWTCGMICFLMYKKYKDNVTGLFANVLVLLSSLSTCISIQYSVVNAYNLMFAMALSLSIVSFINCTNYLSMHKIGRAIEFTAGYSFTLYLVHYSIMDFMARHIPLKNGYAAFVCAFLISNAVAFCISRFSERSFRVMIKAFLYRMRGISSKRNVLEN